MQYIHYQPNRSKVFSLFCTLGIDVHVALYQLFSSGWFQLLGSRVWCKVIVLVRTKFTDTRNRMSLTIISHSRATSSSPSTSTLLKRLYSHCLHERAEIPSTQGMNHFAISMLRPGSRLGLPVQYSTARLPHAKLYRASVADANTASPSG